MLLQEKIAITDWAENERPREKLMVLGRLALTDAELLAILIGSGNVDETAVDLCKRILKDVNNDLQGLSRLTIPELMAYKGIGEAKAITIAAALELGRRRKEQPEMVKKKVTSSKDAYDHIKYFINDLAYEEFWVMMLTRSNNIIGLQKISQGGVSGTVADAKMIFKAALLKTASAVILCHNHPSGNLKPSEADIDLTKKMVEAGKVLEVPVLDHIIYTDNGYFSFADEGLI